MTMRGTAADHIEHWKQVAGRNGQRINLLERQVRDLARDRDEWKRRAQAAEAELKSK